MKSDLYKQSPLLPANIIIYVYNIEFLILAWPKLIFYQMIWS